MGKKNPVSKSWKSKQLSFASRFCQNSREETNVAQTLPALLLKPVLLVWSVFTLVVVDNLQIEHVQSRGTISTPPR